MARYLEDHGDRLVLRPEVEDQLASGVRFAFIAAPLVLFAGCVGAFLAADDTTSFLVGWGASAAISAPLAAYGLFRMVTAKKRAAAGAVSFDLAERLLVRPGCTPEVLRGVEAVALKPARFSGFLVELVHDDARRTPLFSVPRSRGAEISEAVEHLADALGAPRVEIPRHARRVRSFAVRDSKLAAALCYAPIDGVFVAASLWFLMTSNDPFVRFSAKQSLLQLAFSAFCAFLLLGCCTAPIGILSSIGLATLVSALPLVVLATARILVRVLAATRARRGTVWIMPWLAPISRRWAPAMNVE